MSTVFDAGDKQSMEREARLTQQLPRQPIAEDVSPIEEPFEETNDFDIMLDGLLSALKGKL